MGGGVHPPLVGQFPQGDVALRAEQVHEDTRPDYRDHPGLGADARINLIVAVPVGAEVILLPFHGHGLQTTGRHDAALLVDALDDVVHLGAQPFVKQVVQDIALGLPTVVLRFLHRLQYRDNDLVVAVVGDGVGHLRVVRQPLHALDGAGQDLLALQGLHQVQQVAAQLVRIRLNRALSVNGNHALAAPARHSEPAFGLPGVSLGGGRSRLARSLIIWHFRASLGTGLFVRPAFSAFQ